MGEEDIKIRKVENSAARQATFSKRRRSLFKKAHELAVLCDVPVGLVVFSESRKLYEYSSSSTVRDIFSKYDEHPKAEKHFGTTDVARPETEISEGSNLIRNLRGEDIEDIEAIVQSGHCREYELMEQITQLQAKVKNLSEENKQLKHEIGGLNSQKMVEGIQRMEDDESFDVSLRLGYV
ncbi:MADS-box transcription factor 22-like [Wolffia australiana]